MAGLSPSMERPAGPFARGAGVPHPRLLMTWEDWLTFGAALITFLAVSISIQQADWVKNPSMPPVVPTALGGLLIGMVAARVRFPAVVIHPVAIGLGAILVVLVVQTYADGATIADRLEDFRIRMHEWYVVVREGDISNDNLPFVTLVHGVMCLSAYVASWSIYRWHSPWLAVIPGGAVILANIAFLEGQPSAAFVTFLFGAIWLIARMHLQRSQARWNRFHIDYPEFISVPATQLTVGLSILLILGAWFVPLGAEARAVESIWSRVVSPATGQTDQLVRLFHNVDSRKGAQLHTFGSTLPIQGQVKLGTKHLYTVKSGEAGLLRATSYDVYTGNGWKTGHRDSARVDANQLAATGEDIEFKDTRIVAALEVTLFDDASTLLTPGIPVDANLDAIVETPDGYRRDIEQMRSRRGLKKDDSYATFGTVSAASEGQLTLAGTNYPEWVTERYLQVPKSLPQRVKDEARNVMTAGANPYAKAALLEDHLRQFPYDLQVESAPSGRDTVDFFLFDLKRGYFDYHATVMAVMLRTQGIPARIAVGYALDPNEVAEGGVYTVRKDDAYSWVEVFFPGYGWVNFNPTPDKPEGGAGSSLNAGGAAPDDISIDDLFPPGAEDEFINPDVGEVLPEVAPAVVHDSGGGVPWWLIYTLMALLGLAAIAALSFRTAWNWGLSGLDGRARLWAKVQRLAGWARLGPHTNETAREWSRRMGAAIEREPDAIQLAEAYEEVRYGRPDLQRVDESETRGAYLKLRSALASTVLRRGRRPRR